MKPSVLKSFFFFLLLYNNVTSAAAVAVTLRQLPNPLTRPHLFAVRVHLCVRASVHVHTVAPALSRAACHSDALTREKSYFPWRITHVPPRCDPSSRSTNLPATASWNSWRFFVKIPKGELSNYPDIWLPFTEQGRARYLGCLTASRLFFSLFYLSLILSTIHHDDPSLCVGMFFSGP